MLNGVEADLYFTGEMSHHDILRATLASNAAVILTEHTNCERGYLADVLKAKLERESQSCAGSFEFVVSEQDRDPIIIV